MAKDFVHKTYRQNDIPGESFDDWLARGLQEEVDHSFMELICIKAYCRELDKKNRNE